MSMSTVEIPLTTSEQPNSAEAAAAAPAQGGQEQKSQEQKLGSAFAALDRRQKAIEQSELSLKQKQAAFEAMEKERAALNDLPPFEILERVAKSRGTTVEELVKAAIAAKTGAPTPDKALADATDPVSVALRERQARIEKENEDLRKALQERDQKAEQERNGAAIAKAQSDCLSSAKSVFTDESDYPFFWESVDDLGRAVYQACSVRIAEYIKENQVNPEQADVEQLVRDMPAELLRIRLETKAGQRMVALKSKAETPPPPVPGFRPRLTAPNKKVVEGASAQPQIVTRVDHDKRLEEAMKRWPRGKLLPGQQAPPE